MVTANPSSQTLKRRSTRIASRVAVTVRGADGNGQPFVEQRVTLEVSYQGCKFYSRYSLPPNSWLTIEIATSGQSAVPDPFPARVAWLRRSRTLQGLFQVGVEFKMPGNVWGIANPPEDWRPPDAPRVVDTAGFEQEMRELLALSATGTFYQLLGTTSDSTRAQVRLKYYELARKFHPDRHMDHSDWMHPLQKLMEAVTAAYKTLTDADARRKYDERLAASSTFMLGRQRSDVQKTAAECMDKARECFKAQNSGGTILWLRKAAEIEPDSFKYQALLARALSVVPPLRHEAATHFEKALELDPSNTTVRLQLAAMFEEMNLPWRALPHYRKVLEIDATNAKAEERLRALDTDADKDGMSKRSFINRILGNSPK